MNKNRKLLSLICAFAMIVSVFSSFTIVNATTNDEITQGITLTLGEVDEDNNTIEIIAGFKGIADGYSSGLVSFAVPSTVTNVEVTSESIGSGALVFENSVVNYATATTNPAEGPDGDIATFLLTLSSPLSSDTDVTLADTSYMYDSNQVYYGITDLYDGDVEISAVTVTLPKNSSVTTTDATRAPEMEDEGDDDGDLDDIIDITSGITLTLGEVDTENNTVEIIAGFVGIADGYSSGLVSFAVPSTVTNVEVTSESIGSGALVFENSVVNYATATTNPAEGPDGEIARFLLTFSEPLTSTYQITLADTSYMYDSSQVYYGITDLYEGDVQIVAANVNIPAFDSDTEDLEEVGEIPMSDAITVSVDEEVAEGDVSNYYIVATVMKGDEEAVYGTDYVATYNGVELTYAQYSNLINGYFSASNVADLGVTSMQDVIDNLVYVLYDENVTVKAQLVDAATSTILNPDDEEQSLDSGSSSTFKTPTLTVSPSSKTVSTGTTVTIESTIKNPTDDGVLTIDVGDADDYVTKLSIDEDEGTVSFKAALAGTVKAVFEYTYTNPNTEKEVTLSKTSTIKIKSSSSSDSSSSSSSGSSSGSTGSIAGANTSGSTGSSLYTTFSDLGDATWAAQAILALAQKGIVSGRGDGTFDPNGNITRAEYCQILVGAIGKTSESADSSFADVASDAWYYHAISVASNYGIVVGYGDGNFGPNDLITRQDMALMTYKAAQVMSLGVAATTSTSFTDADQISAYALEAVASLNNAGIINGMGDGTYGPLANATRAQAAVILYQAFVQ